MDDDFDRHLRALEARELDHLERWEEAAEYFQAQAARGRDLSPAVKGLERVYLDSHQLPVMIPAMAALTRHHLRKGDTKALQRLLRDKDFRDYALQALESHGKAGVKVAPALPFVLDALSFSSRFDVFRVLRPFLRKDPAGVARNILEHPRARRHLADLAKDAMQDGLGDKVDLSPLATALGSLLAEARLQEDAAWALRWMVEGKVDLAEAMPALVGALTDRKGEVRSQAAYCLAFDRIPKEDPWPLVDMLLSHRLPEVRDGACRALCVQLCANGRNEPELVSRLARALLDPDARRSALQGLQAALRKDLELPLLQGVPGELAARVDGDGVAEFLAWWVRRYPDRAAEVLDRLPEDHPLRASAADPVCSLCRHLPRLVHTSFDWEVPAEVSRLVPGGPVDNSLRHCPECGNLYRLSYSEEWLSPSEGMGLEVDIRVERLSPPDTLKALRGEERVRYKEGYPALLATLQGRLRHPDAEVRREAAWALARHFVNAKDPGGLEGLLHHSDPLVRLECLRSLEEGSLVASALEALLEDPESAVRLAACDLLARNRIATGDREGILRLLDLEEPALKEVPLRHLVWREQAEPFREAFEQALGSDFADVRHAGIRGVASLGDGAAILPLVDHPEVETRKEAWSALQGLADRWGDLAPEVVRRAAAALEAPEVGYWALCVLRAAPSDTDLSPAWPALVRRMAGGSHGQDAGWLLSQAVQAAAGRGEDLSSLVPALAPLMDAPEAVRSSVGTCFQILADQDVDLTPALDPLMKSVTRLRPTYVESYLAASLARYLARRGDWERLDLLLLSPMDVSGAASGELPLAGGPDMEPLLPTLLGLLPGKEWYSRDHARQALEQYAALSPAHLARVARALEQVPVKAEDPKALAFLERVRRA